MREIKFRAWDKEKKLMVDDFYFRSNGIAYHIGTDRNVANEYEVMQYTGLKDKNGKEIYESDYLGDWCVFWGSGQYILQNISTGDIMMCNEISIEGKEVTGNRYENPREHTTMASDL